MKVKLGQWQNGRFDHGPTFTGTEKWITKQVVRLEKASGRPVTVVPLVEP